MALNKYFTFMRKNAENPNINKTHFENKLPCVFVNDESFNVFQTAANTTIKIESFLVEQFAALISEMENFLIAKNSIGDYLIELSNLNIVFSIKAADGIGKFSVYKNGNISTENIINNAFTQAYMAWKIATDDTGTILKNLQDSDNKNVCEAFANFLVEVRDELFAADTDAFYSTSGTFNEFDINAGLPFTNGMIAKKSIKINVAVDSYGISVCDMNNINIFAPDSNDFKSVLAASCQETEDVKSFQEITTFNVTPDREFTLEEQEMIAENEENTSAFILDPGTKEYLEDFVDLFRAKMPIQSSAFYGPSGAGKTVRAQVVARELHRPYVAFKMRENSDEDSLRGTIKSIQGKESGNIEYEDSTIVKALKNGWVCEVQELSVCSNPGAETFFNPILDKTKCFEDASGKTFNVHPDALIIFTYNPDYTENNQIATSLLNRIDDNYSVSFPDEQTCINIFKKNTGYMNDAVLSKIYNLCFGDGTTIGSIAEKIKDEDIEEELSIRQVCNWIKRYISCRRYYNQENGWVNAAYPTIIRSLGVREPEFQEDIATLIESVF